MTATQDRAKEQLKDCLVTYLERKGIDINKQFRCLNPAHDDKNPSMSYDKKRNKVHCFSCGVDYDIIDLIQQEYNISDVKEAFKKGYELFGIDAGYYTDNTYTHNKHNTDNTHKKSEYMSNPNDNKTKANKKKPVFDEDYFNQCNKAFNDNSISYLENRGISNKTANLFNIGYDENFYFVVQKDTSKNFNAPAIIIPTNINSCVARCITPNALERYNKRGHISIFNMKVCRGVEPVFVVEGEIDALSIIEAGYNALALGSVAYANKFINILGIDKPSCPFVLCLDNDDAGREAQNKIIAEFKRLNMSFSVANIAGQYKDANEALINNREAFIISLQEAINNIKKTQEAELEKLKEEYKKNYASNCMQEFIDGIKERANTPYIPTGFSGLDEKLDGGLYEGLYFIGAVSSLGKTTFVLQIADQIAQQGHDVLIFSLEMSKYELIAKSLSRLTLLNCNNNTKNAKTTRGITTYSKYASYSSEVITLINTAIKQYSDYANHIVIREGLGDIGVRQIREATETHIRLTGNKPVVVVDYLQIVAPYNDKGTDKQNIDKAVIELKRISRDCKIPVIAISSLNRESYKEGNKKRNINMADFKESGGIEYSSDVLIGLQFKGQAEANFNIDEAKKKSNDVNMPREIQAIILKNRNGRSYNDVFYDYYPAFNYFKEQ